jgi:hypothetical protein
MRIGLIITEFESGFASSFKHTARVKYGVDFDSSIVESILNNLELLKNKISSSLEPDTKVGWKMNLDHVLMLERLLYEIINKYEELFYIKPLDKKIYTINAKLREAEQPAPKDFAREVIQAVFSPPESKKMSRAEQIKIEAQNRSLSRAIKASNKSKI